MDYVGRPLLACVFVALLWLQWRFPLRRQHFSMLHRLVRNFVLSIPGFAIVRLAMLPIPIAVAMWAQPRHIGLLNWLALPAWIVGIATFLLMDYAYWWWDKLYRTLRRDVPKDAIIIGVAAYREEHELTLGKLLALPFRGQRPWRLPNGEEPLREPRPAEKLAE